MKKTVEFKNNSLLSLKYIISMEIIYEEPYFILELRMIDGSIAKSFYKTEVDVKESYNEIKNGIEELK